MTPLGNNPSAKQGNNLLFIKIADPPFSFWGGDIHPSLSGRVRVVKRDSVEPTTKSYVTQSNYAESIEMGFLALWLGQQGLVLTGNLNRARGKGQELSNPLGSILIHETASVFHFAVHPIKAPKAQKHAHAEVESRYRLRIEFFLG